ncbi:MAG: UDP-glucose 4-epimerase [Bacteroidetes bacterium ADurb.Bin141]|nr:UDP-glucose 4-epimerase GalE [Bacteroidota bacterium]MCB8931489.1 UDP-glucose 4-epimerase GalE [Bacteroidia bacterium]MCW5930074.1 UDP-glucose 4-epimerase GalE [Bacteroidota bacterium]OQB60215.1 MAG: UDP-glucose 4-epimerase [Bacteroidetes bacterium ADurb.Bin141]HRV53331.1 UDP-glucose 4-epimerase GalE [Bacteroidia bacterium]
MKILVTGGTGYIGAHTVVELMQSGFDVDVIDNFNNSKPEVIDAIEQIVKKRPAFFQIDLTNAAATEHYFKTHKPDATVHFAAHKAVGLSVEQPLEFYRNNLLSLINVLQSCLNHGVHHFVFSSSCSVYADPDKLPIDENAPVKKAKSPYGNTKKTGEEIIEDTVAATKLNAISLRYFNPVGSHDSALIGELPTNMPLNVMPIITKVAIGKQEVFTVFGNDYPTPDGSCIRDYIHVTDVAQAHVTAVKRLLNKGNKNRYEVFNLGTGKGSSVFELINAFEKVTGLKLNYKVVKRREGDAVAVYADTTLANTELKWKAQRDLDNMIKTAWNWELHLAGRNDFV